MKWNLEKNKQALVARGMRMASLFSQGMHPARDWLTGLLAASIVFVAAASFIAYDFHMQFVLPPEAAAIGNIGVKYSERDVKYYADRFRGKDTRFAELRGNSVSSLPDTTRSSESEDAPLAEDASGEYTTPALSP